MQFLRGFWLKRSVVVAVFQEKAESRKRLNLPSILKETCVLHKYLGIFVNYTYFHEKRCTREVRLEQKCAFLLTIVYLAFGFTTFAKNLLPG